MAGKNKSSTFAVPDNVMQMLADADKRKGFAPGTMYSVMMQEAGGKLDKFLTDPTAYHYGLNKDGKRVAGRTGKVSTAFGPLGILESTARDPGYGIKPLQDKSLAEQIRFASDYLAKRGLAAYGEGKKYADQVAARIKGKAGDIRDAATQMASAAASKLNNRGRIQRNAPAPYDPSMVAAVPADRFGGSSAEPTAPEFSAMAQVDVPAVDAPVNVSVPVLAGEVAPAQVVASNGGWGSATTVGAPVDLGVAYGKADPWRQFQASMAKTPSVADLAFGATQPQPSYQSLFGGRPAGQKYQSDLIPLALLGG